MLIYSAAFDRYIFNNEIIYMVRRRKHGNRLRVEIKLITFNL